MRVIITGTTGMVGEGVLLECLQNNKVSEVLSISRRSCGIKNPKLKELSVPDFTKLQDFENDIKGYDACYYCAGISSAGMSEEKYNYITYDTTIAFARALLEANPKITFCYVSGRSTDSTQLGKVMWARIKGKTENALKQMPFKSEYNFRPSLMKPTKGQKHFYGYNRWAHKIFYPLFSLFFPTCTIQEIGKAMINVTLKRYSKNVLDEKDIKMMAQ
ncbi:NAD-dependent epimerase/dehydratase family protein [Belliella marina]|uniref:NAD-dependent epimerase/dehydratase family protein n=1 Tax=Belliella marina TaxID=1644146 RepID=A0ABW4VRX7_9BACT